MTENKFMFYFLILLLFLPSCGYRMQTRASLPFEKISVGTINNKTFEPKIQDSLYRVLTETLMEYGFHVVPYARHRIDADITRFDLNTLSEKDLTASEYETIIKCIFRIVDTENPATPVILDISSPFVTYFDTSTKIENVISQKELSIKNALKNLSQELARQIIYKKGPVAGSLPPTKK